MKKRFVSLLVLGMVVFSAMIVNAQEIDVSTLTKEELKDLQLQVSQELFNRNMSAVTETEAEGDNDIILTERFEFSFVDEDNYVIEDLGTDGNPENWSVQVFVGDENPVHTGFNGYFEDATPITEVSTSDEVDLSREVNNNLWALFQEIDTGLYCAINLYLE